MKNYNERKQNDHTIHLRISSGLFDELKTRAINEERSVSGMVKYIVSQFLKYKIQLP